MLVPDHAVLHRPLDPVGGLVGAGVEVQVSVISVANGKEGLSDHDWRWTRRFSIGLRDQVGSVR
jgi:hypothetical protein